MIRKPGAATILGHLILILLVPELKQAQSQSGQERLKKSSCFRCDGAKPTTITRRLSANPWNCWVAPRKKWRSRWPNSSRYLARTSSRLRLHFQRVGDHVEGIVPRLFPAYQRICRDQIIGVLTRGRTSPLTSTAEPFQKTIGASPREKGTSPALLHWSLRES